MGGPTTVVTRAAATARRSRARARSLLRPERAHRERRSLVRRRRSRRSGRRRPLGRPRGGIAEPGSGPAGSTPTAPAAPGQSGRPRRGSRRGGSRSVASGRDLAQIARAHLVAAGRGDHRRQPDPGRVGQRIERVGQQLGTHRAAAGHRIDGRGGPRPAPPQPDQRSRRVLSVTRGLGITRRPRPTDPVVATTNDGVMMSAHGCHRVGTRGQIDVVEADQGALLDLRSDDGQPLRITFDDRWRLDPGDGAPARVRRRAARRRCDRVDVRLHPRPHR